MGFSNISEIKKTALVHCIQRGLERTRLVFEQNDIAYRNWPGLMALNCIFDSASKLTSFFDVYSFKRRAFSFTLLYDSATGALINFVSQATLNKLEKRRKVTRVHYCDALVLNNSKINEPQQLCLFEDESIEEDRKVIYRQIEQAIDNLQPTCHIFVVYDIDSKHFTLRSIKEAVRTIHYYPVFNESWNQFILTDVDDINGTDASTPEEDLFGVEHTKSNLTISLKPHVSLDNKE